LAPSSARSFNPLHCGAVVASERSKGGHTGLCWFQSPSLRGSGRFVNSTSSNSVAQVSFNPLHCGAVVASPGRFSRAFGTFLSFNPLHCGAVVASEERARKEASARRVSIPFIAGQWSLQSRPAGLSCG